MDRKNNGRYVMFQRQLPYLEVLHGPGCSDLPIITLHDNSCQWNTTYLRNNGITQFVTADLKRRPCRKTDTSLLFRLAQGRERRRLREIIYDNIRVTNREKTKGTKAMSILFEWPDTWLKHFRRSPNSKCFYALKRRLHDDTFTFDWRLIRLRHQSLLVRQLRA